MSELSKIVDRHVEQLLEHFDNVQIFCSRLDEGDAEGKNTHDVTAGGGNWHARTGYVRTWLNRVDARERADALQEDPDEDG